MKRLDHLEGHLPADSFLSTRLLFKKLPALTKPLIKYKIESLWEHDTKSLPPALRKARRRLRNFSEREIKPRALKMDTLHMQAGEIHPEIQKLLSVAANEGILTDLLPKPFGTNAVAAFAYPIAWFHAIRAEELARGCGGLAMLFLAHVLGAAPIVYSGDISAIRRFLLPAFRKTKQGEIHLFAFAITEPSMGSDAEEGHGASLAKPGVVARRVDGGWVLRGRKIFISGGDLAKSITVFAALENKGIESWTCFLVNNDMEGFRVVRTEIKMGLRASGTAELEFSDVFVPDTHVIGKLKSGWALNRAVLNTSRIPVAGMAVGLAQDATETAIEFACQNRMAGKALIHYQEIQIMVAQMIADTSAIRSLVWNVARKSYAPRQDNASISKFYATDVAINVCMTAMDLMSNHGILHANKTEKIYRDTRVTQIFEGTNQINRLAVIDDQQEQFLKKIFTHFGKKS